MKIKKKGVKRTFQAFSRVISYGPFFIVGVDGGIHWGILEEKVGRRGRHDFDMDARNL